MEKKTNGNDLTSITTNLLGDNKGVIHAGNGDINVGLNIDPKDLLSSLIQQIPGFSKVAELKTESSIEDIIGLPALPINICRREKSIEKQVGLFNIKTWLNYYGDVWSGKTFFVTLLVARYKENTTWFRLKGLNDNQVNNVIKLILSNIGIDSTNNAISKHVHNDKINLKQDSIIVLDDIPVFNRTSTYFESFVTLVNACKEQNIKLITTTQQCVQAQVQLFLRAEDFESIKIPEFAEEDIEQMLTLYDAKPDFINEKFISFLKSNTKGNPALANAVCSYMSKENWIINSSGIFGIINGGYYWQINSEIQDILYATINDDCRELLYRISEIGWSVSEKDIVSISSINPIIKFPLEKVNKLLGSWISLDTDKKYLASPLISKISKNNITNDTRKGIHEVIANNILAKGVLNQFEAIRVVTHFINAENYISAGLTYINILNEMHQANIYEDYWYVSLIWYNTQLPKLMPIDIKIPLRAVQIIYCYKANKDINYLQNDFEILLQTCPNYLKVFAFYVAIFIYKMDIKKANQYIIYSLNELPKIVDIAKNNKIGDNHIIKKHIDNLKPETAFLITSSEIKTPDDLIDWIETVKKLSKVQLRNLFGDDMFPDSYMVLPSRVWLHERTKNEEFREWNKVLNSIEHIITFSRDNDLELLWACSVRAKIIILTEEVDEFDFGIKVGMEAVQQASDEPAVQYVLNDIIAKEYAYKKEYDKAILMFKRIINQETVPFGVEKVMTYLLYSEAIEKDDTNESVNYSYMALKLVEKLEGVKKYFHVQVLVEHIVCLWNCGKQRETPFYIEQAVEKILDCKEDDMGWKKVFITTGHILCYYIPVLTGKSAPEKCLDGEVYTIPYRMLSVKDKPDVLADLFDEEKLFVSPLSIFLLFKHLNNEEKSIKWAKIVFSLSKTSSHKELLLAGYYDLGYYLLVGREYEAAFRILVYINFINIFLQNNCDIDKKSDTLFYFNNASEELKKAVENNSLLLWGIPVFIEICNRVLISENEAKKESILVIDAINSLKSILINKTICDEIIEVINNIIEKRTNYEKLIKQGNSYSSNNNYLLQTITYLAAIMYATPEQSINTQTKIIPFIDSYFSAYNIIYENIVRFFKNHWIVQINKDNSKFGIPWKTKNRVEKIDAAKGVNEIKRLLSIILSVLNINLSDDIINWFDKE